MKYFLLALKRYADFNGRSNRPEYWYFVLFQIIFLIAAMIVDMTIGTYMIFYAIVALGLIVPGIAVTVRRLHDLDKSGWNILIGLIPLIGGIWLLVLMVQEGTRGPNKYGDNPNFPAFEFEAQQTPTTQP